MPKYITKAQRAELADAEEYGDGDLHELLQKYAGIRAEPYTAYMYYDEVGNFLACDDDTDVDSLLEMAYVEVRDE